MPTEKIIASSKELLLSSNGQNLAEDNNVLPDDDDLASDRSQGTRSDLTLDESKRDSAERDKRLHIDAKLEADIRRAARRSQVGI